MRTTHTRSSYAFFSRPVYFIWWVSLLLLHFVGAAFFAAAATGYWLLPNTYLESCLTFYSLGMPADSHPKLAQVHFAIAGCHVAFALWMIGWSLRRRALVFGSGDTAISSSTAIKPDHELRQVSRSSTSRNSSENAETPPSAPAVWQRLCAQLRSGVQFLWELYCAIFGRRGFFGVDNAKFDFLLVLREVVETVLQTVQAYRMSLFLPRTWLNRFYVALLVLNCWSTVLVHHLYHDSPPRRRVMAILCDCILDATTSIGIPLILVLDYARDYDFTIHGFDTTLWYDDIWFVNVLNEFQLILVVSWSDLATRVLFGYGTISSMNSIKNLVRPLPNCIRVSQPGVGPLGTSVTSLVAILPGTERHKHEMKAGNISDKGIRNITVAQTKSKRLLRSLSILVASKSPSWRRTILTRSFSALFLLWGLVILALHSHADLNPSLPECKLQVRPWFVTSSACSLVELDCVNADTDGNMERIDAMWSELDDRAVVRVVVKHCPRLQMSSTLQKFYNLNGMKFYNSTVDHWGVESQLTHTHHPKIMSLLFVRVNFTNGELPLGLQATDFPHLLADFEFCVTNLETLPDDLDLKWPKFATVYLELGTLTVVPEVLARLAPSYLSFAGSPIQDLPASLFEADGIYYLHAGGTNVTSLPQNVTRMGSYFSFLVLQDTNVSLFWSWIDEVLENPALYSRVFAANTLYCELYKQFLQQESPNPELVATRGVGELSRLMDFSDPNREFLFKKVLCTEIFATIYPIAFEDTYSGMRTVNAGL